jgi:type VI secretion system secreted protein Hcp
MAFDAFLKLEGVEGSATRKGYENQIFLDSFSWGAHNPTSVVGSGHGAGAGRVEISHFSVTKKTDKSSPKLFQACCTGKHFPKAILTILKAGGENPVDYLKYEMETLFVSDFQESGASNGGDDIPVETISFAFGKVNMLFTEQKPDGSKGGTVAAGWDLKGSKPV